METIESDAVRRGGGRHIIKIGVKFEDPETPDYIHGLVWYMQPTLATDSQTPFLKISNFLHKKYWRELDVNLSRPTPDDGSEVVFSGGVPPIQPELPESVVEEMKFMFGEKLTENTLNKQSDILRGDVDTVPVPDIPEEHSVVIPEFTVRIDGDYVTEIDEEDSRVEDGRFTSEMKDAETGEVLETSHRVNHNLAWWFEPSEEGGLQVSKCFHKTWDDATTSDFDDDCEGEELVESYTKSSETPFISDLPDSILEGLCSWFGEPLLREMLSEEDLPRNVYECLDCDSVTEVTPRDSCPKCGSDGIVTYESLEQYREMKEEETEEDRRLKEFLVNAEVNVSRGN